MIIENHYLDNQPSEYVLSQIQYVVHTMTSFDVLRIYFGQKELETQQKILIDSAFGC